MTDSGNGTPAELNTPVVWNARLSTAIALAIREYGDGNPHRAQAALRSALEDFLGESGCSNELTDTLVRTARLPRVEPTP